MKVEINIKDKDEVVYSVMFTVTKMQYEMLKHYIGTLIAKFKNSNE